MLQNCIYCQKFNFSWFFFWSCKFDVLWYFHQLRSCRMGAFVMNYVNTAHDAVKYCTNTPKEYKSPWIKCLFIYIFLGMYWELHGLGSSRMGPCRRISIMLWNSVQIPQNGMTDTEYFLALIIFCQKYNVFYLTQNGLIFLDASSHLYKRVCPSVGPSVGP